MHLLCASFTDTASADPWIQTQKLSASDAGPSDWFGKALAIDGDFAIIGAPDANAPAVPSAGAAYIFQRIGSNWTQTAKLTAEDAAENDSFGAAVDIKQNYAIIGAPYADPCGYSSAGAAYIFKFNGSNWTQIKKLIDPNTANLDNFGEAVAIDSTYALIGSSSDDDNGSSSGSAHIYKNNSDTWPYHQKLTPTDPDAYDYFGIAAAIDQNNLIIGAHGNTPAGCAYVFKLQNNNWTQSQKLTPSACEENGFFGYKLDLDSNNIVIGALADLGYAGSAFIYSYNGSTWQQKPKLTVSDTSSNNYFGSSVSISDDYCLIGASGNDATGTNAGRAYLFEPNGLSWQQTQQLTPNDIAAGDAFGYAAAIDNAYALIGSYSDDDHGTSSGSAYIFKNTTPGSLTLTNPNGSEQILAGSQTAINWNTQLIVDYVAIDYSADAGFSWTHIDTTANIGSYNWTAPPIETRRCLIKISDPNNTDTNDISDNFFRIYICPDWLTADYNSDCIVDTNDLINLIDYWLEQNCTPPHYCSGADNNHTGKVDFADYTALLSQWLVSAKCPSSDLNDDCWIDNYDLAAVSENWKLPNCTAPDFCSLADLNFDGIVDLQDLAAMLQQWLTCGDNTGRNCPQ